MVMPVLLTFWTVSDVCFISWDVFFVHMFEGKTGVLPQGHIKPIDFGTESLQFCNTPMPRNDDGPIVYISQSQGQTTPKSTDLRVAIDSHDGFKRQERTSKHEPL